jgi:hypothetical protein
VLWHSVVFWTSTDLWKELAPSVFRVKICRLTIMLSLIGSLHYFREKLTVALRGAVLAHFSYLSTLLPTKILHIWKNGALALLHFTPATTKHCGSYKGRLLWISLRWFRSLFSLSPFSLGNTFVLTCMCNEKCSWTFPLKYSKWKQHIPPKRRYPLTKLHDVTTQDNNYKDALHY